jgi:uncharacterized repeat protein (TIGR03943 family)
VVSFGAIALSAATILYARAGAGAPDARRPLAAGEAAGLAALLAPVLIAFLMAHAALGSLAASRKLGSRGIDVAKLASRLSAHPSHTGFLELKMAARDERWAAGAGIAPGRSVDLTGFVLHPATRNGGSFELARFYITCCVADSLPIGATIVPAVPLRAYPKDTWLEVTGAVARRGDSFVVDAVRVRRVNQPRNPYLNFQS